MWTLDFSGSIYNRVIKPETKPVILLLDDDKLFTRIVEYQLRHQGFATTICNSTKDLYDYFATGQIPDAFVIDWNLGDSQPTGLEICRKIKMYCNSPVLVLTANNSIDALTSCFSAGASHYIVKPCDIRELTARIKSCLIQTPGKESTETSCFEVVIDDNLKLSCSREMLINADGRVAKLTLHELGLMEIFLSHRSKFIDRGEAFSALYGYEMDPTNRRIDLLVSRLRRKISSVTTEYTIKSVRGHGYKFIKA